MYQWYLYYTESIHFHFQIYKIREIGTTESDMDKNNKTDKNTKKNINITDKIKYHKFSFISLIILLIGAKYAPLGNLCLLPSSSSSPKPRSSSS